MTFTFIDGESCIKQDYYSFLEEPLPLNFEDCFIQDDWGCLSEQFKIGKNIFKCHLVTCCKDAEEIYEDEMYKLAAISPIKES